MCRFRSLARENSLGHNGQMAGGSSELEVDRGSVISFKLFGYEVTSREVIQSIHREVCSEDPNTLERVPLIRLTIHGCPVCEVERFEIPGWGCAGGNAASARREAVRSSCDSLKWFCCRKRNKVEQEEGQICELSVVAWGVWGNEWFAEWHYTWARLVSQRVTCRVRKSKTSFWILKLDLRCIMLRKVQKWKQKDKGDGLMNPAPFVSQKLLSCIVLGLYSPLTCSCIMMYCFKVLSYREVVAFWTTAIDLQHQNSRESPQVPNSERRLEHTCSWNLWNIRVEFSMSGVSNNCPRKKNASELAYHIWSLACLNHYSLPAYVPTFSKDIKRATMDLGPVWIVIWTQARFHLLRLYRALCVQKNVTIYTLIFITTSRTTFQLY